MTCRRKINWLIVLTALSIVLLDVAVSLALMGSRVHTKTKIVFVILALASTIITLVTDGN